MWKIFSVPCGSALYKFHCIRRWRDVQETGEWTRRRRDEWKEDVTRMTPERTVGAVGDKSPAGRRILGRPCKRWSNSICGDSKLVV
jgi:hypothetical protein